MFSVFHLDHITLSTLERNFAKLKANTPEEKATLKKHGDAVQHFKKLLDVSALYEEGIDFESVWLEKCASALELLDKGYYRHVADISVSTAREALSKTHNGLARWYLTNDKSIDVINIPTRETYSYDIFVKDGGRLLHTSTGWLNLDTGEFLSVNTKAA